MGFGVEGLIPRAVIRDYARDEGLDFKDLFWRVRVLDLHHRKCMDEERKQQAEREQRAAERKNQRAGGSPRRR